MYLRALNLVDGALAMRCDISSTNTLGSLIEDVQIEDEIVNQLKLDKAAFASDYDYKGFEQLAIPELFRYKMKYRKVPSEQLARSIVRQHPDRYPMEEQFQGWEIVVEADSYTSPAEAQTVLRSIERDLQSQPFHQVAVTYYMGIGTEYDGSLGVVRRGQIPDWKFDLFMKAKSSAPFFGPIRIPKGYLWGKVLSRREPDADPLDYYGDYIIQMMLSGPFKETMEKYYNEQVELQKPRVFQYDHHSTAGVEQVAYCLGGEAVTYARVLARLPHYSGNPKDPRFHDAMAKHAFENDLIYYGPDAEGIRKSSEFRWLAAAHRNAFLVDRYVKEQLKNCEMDEAAITRFYQEHKKDLFAQPELVRLIVLSRKRDASRDRDPDFRSYPRKPEWMAMGVLREEFLKNPTPEGARQLAASHPNLDVTIHEKAVPLDKLGRVLEMGIEGLKEGEVSLPLTGSQEYHLVTVLSRRKQPPTSNAQVENLLRSQYLMDCKTSVLKGLYKTERAASYF